MPLLKDEKKRGRTKVRFFIVVKALNCLWRERGISGIFESLSNDQKITSRFCIWSFGAILRYFFQR